MIVEMLFGKLQYSSSTLNIPAKAFKHYQRSTCLEKAKQKPMSKPCKNNIQIV